MQQIVWPTDKNRVEGMKFSTEEFRRRLLDECDVHTLLRLPTAPGRRGHSARF